eukprot:TRINITY_DN53926_c0_g1_i1.p1 TRINITY_DN53926_c0_g1~~TRINITY_DN53926_c0_g1_i1.p1  ORF type:complete len:271 (-),score=36.78 TRINITY_DN53926_c0_g1_i1:34-846(-)
MIEFGLAESSFKGNSWRPATLEDVKATSANISSLEIKFLHDFVLTTDSPCSAYIHIGGSRLHNGTRLIELQRLPGKQIYKAGSRPKFEADGSVTCVEWPLLDSTSKGYIHIFMKDSSHESLGHFLWQERSFPDAVVTCGQVRFDVHRAVLAQNHVFKQGFSGSMVEAQAAEFDIKDSEPAAVEALLRHIYTRQTDAPENILAPLLELAVQYEEPDLIRTVASALAEVCVDTVREHGRALKLHRDHPDVEAAYQKFREAVCQDPTLVDSLI